jgi:putative ABC transport system permease protein
MFRHALKLIWNRRRANRLVVVEIAAGFVITFVLTAIAVDFVSNYRRPLGFDYEDVLNVTVQAEELAGNPRDVVAFLSRESYSGTLEYVLAALRALPPTETVAPIVSVPFRAGSRFTFNMLLSPTLNRTTAEALQAIGVDLVAGRWFGPEDEGQAYRAVLVNRAYAEQAFGSDAEAVGQRIDRPDTSSPFATEEQPQTVREVRIVGVIEDFRQGGELSATTPYVIERHEPADEWGPSFTLLLRTVPGTDAGFGEQIVETIESVAPGWLASVTSWEQLRASRLSSTLLPLKAGATIAAFFIALVVLGLIGVLWQDVVRRTQEIGLRRAVGAGAASVRRQIQVEMLIVGAFGILIGAVIAIQFPLLELIGPINWRSSIPALALSAAAILILIVLGALYPSWLASRREPADALRYE